jgi:hypothetical protein
MSGPVEQKMMLRCKAILRDRRSRDCTLFGQAELALSQDVLLYLAGAACDRVLARTEHPLLPSGRVGHDVGRLPEQRIFA